MQYESICRLWSLLPLCLFSNGAFPPFFQLDLITRFLPRGRLARGTFRFSSPHPSNGFIDRFLVDSARYTRDERNRSLLPKSKSTEKPWMGNGLGLARVLRVSSREQPCSPDTGKLSGTSFRRKSIRVASPTTRIYVIKSFQLVPFVLLGRKFN